MAAETLDDVDWRLLEALQSDGRASYADLGRLVGLSPSAVTERVRRLEESGVITGYAAEVDPEKLGLTIMALVRVRYPSGNYRPFRDLLATTPEVGEAHHVTGEDCFVLTVRARSMRHLEEVSGRIAGARCRHHQRRVLDAAGTPPGGAQRGGRVRRGGQRVAPPRLRGAGVLGGAHER